ESPDRGLLFRSRQRCNRSERIVISQFTCQRGHQWEVPASTPELSTACPVCTELAVTLSHHGGGDAQVATLPEGDTAPDGPLRALDETPFVPGYEVLEVLGQG